MIAKTFKNGGSLAMRIPKEYNFDNKTLLQTKVNGMMIVIPEKDPLALMFEALSEFSDDFLNEPLEQLPVQERDGL